MRNDEFKTAQAALNSSFIIPHSSLKLKRCRASRRWQRVSVKLSCARRFGASGVTPHAAARMAMVVAMMVRRRVDAWSHFLKLPEAALSGPRPLYPTFRKTVKPRLIRA
jgi:hypothetical protein